MQPESVDPITSARLPEAKRRVRRLPGREEGQALIATVISISLVLLILLVAISITQFSNKALARQLVFEGQALNAAEAGITDSLSWFRNQASSGGAVVTAFAPGTADSDCPTTGTGCPNAGIVRTFDVSVGANLKGRYEAVIGTTGGTSGVVDVTNQTIGALGGSPPAGTVWQLESTGYIWINNDSTKNFNQSPNMIISKETVRTQIQRLTVNLPQGGAALFCGTNSKITIGAKAKLKGGVGVGLAYAATTQTVSVNASASITGTPTGTKTGSTSAYDIPTVFGVTQAQLLTLADAQYSQMSAVPATLPSMSLIIYNGNALFNDDQPLVGSGILVVLGNLQIQNQVNPSNYNGVIYVTGNFELDNPSSVDGAIIANASGTAANTVTVGNTSTNDIAELDYDTSIIQQINKQMGQYRYTRGMAWVGK